MSLEGLGITFGGLGMVKNVCETYCYPPNKDHCKITIPFNSPTNYI